MRSSAWRSFASIRFLHPCKKKGLAPLPSGDCFPCFAIERASAFGFAPVPKLLSFSQCKFDFHPPVFEVDAGGDEGQSLCLGLANQFADFIFMHQQLASAQRLMIRVAAMLVGADVSVE